MPPDGLCLNAFVLVHPDGEPRRILMGKLDPSAAWDRIGGLDPRRAQHAATGWMLPSSHLLWFEAPETAAQRIATEQLGGAELHWETSRVYSETYFRSEVPGSVPHWDVHFVHLASWTGDGAPHAAAWKELAFVDPTRVPSEAMVRGHGDLLALAGLAPSRTD